MIVLETKKITDISGEFIVPSYQRGYRWQEEVARLLEDIMEIKKQDNSRDYSYCLQPIVVKNLGNNRFELIDGQQRLTTIFLIYKVIKEFMPNISVNFSLTYQTRGESREFLENIENKEFEKENNIDFYFMWNAYQAIQEWIKSKNNPTNVAINIYNLLSETVQIIWYEVDEKVDSNLLFQRLNIGKIPLTSAELVKAIFLSENSTNKRKEEIAFQWDNIEKELHDKAFWGFLSNDDSYQTRIDLVLNLIANQEKDSKDKYATFFYFDNLRKTKNLDDMWDEIQQKFLLLKDWFKNHTLYHKIGYLICVGYSLQEIFDLSKDKTKTKFVCALDEKIKDSVKLNPNRNKDKYGDLTYEDKTDCKKISTLLLLFNVESTRLNGEQSEWFAFEKFKENKWSLEHIHAQRSIALNKQEQFKDWVNLHIESVKTVGKLQIDNQKLTQQELNALLKDMTDFKDQKTNLQETFEKIQRRVLNILSEDLSVEYEHSIANLALLNTKDNAALNNSTFDVKRNKIIEMDKEGKFIPYCTKMVFLKYYTKSEGNQLHFWGHIDRESYIEEINRVLSDFIDKIKIEKEND